VGINGGCSLFLWCSFLHFQKILHHVHLQDKWHVTQLFFNKFQNNDWHDKSLDKVTDYRWRETLDFVGIFITAAWVTHQFLQKKWKTNLIMKKTKNNLISWKLIIIHTHVTTFPSQIALNMYIPCFLQLLNDIKSQQLRFCQSQDSPESKWQTKTIN
jgi:hypothetical protein